MTVLHCVNPLGHIIKFSCSPNDSHLIRSQNLYCTNFFPLSKGLRTILHVILWKIIVFLLPFSKQDFNRPCETYILCSWWNKKVLHLHSVIQQRCFTYIQLFNKGASLTFNYSTKVLHLHSIIQQRYFTYIKLFNFKNIRTLVT
jgi:hypothetical protein